MITLDGVQYEVKSPADNTSDLVNYINTYCSNNNVVNSKNEVIQIEQNFTSPIYLICWGLGYFINIIQRLLLSVGNAISISSSSDRQLLNLADIAGMKRRPATKTTLRANISADLAEDCTITTSLTATVNINNTTLTFHPAYDVIIPGGSNVIMPLIPVQDGAFDIGDNVVTKFDTDVQYLRSMSTVTQIGQDQETIAHLRQRLQRRADSGTAIDKAMDAINSLSGVALCNIFFNYASSSSITVDGITVPPRQALLIIQGYSNDIAKTFYKYLTCETVPGSADENMTQVYTTLSGQQLTINFIPPKRVLCYVRVYLNQVLEEGFSVYIKDVLMQVKANLTIGQSLTQEMLMNLLLADEKVATSALQGIELATSAGGAPLYTIEALANQLLNITQNSVQVISTVVEREDI